MFDLLIDGVESLGDVARFINETGPIPYAAAVVLLGAFIAWVHFGK